VMITVDEVAFQRCSPPVTVVPETVVLDGRNVVVLNVPKGDQRPYSTSEGKHFVRSGSRCRQASREELLRLFQASHALFYDEQPLPRVTRDDLDLSAVERFLHEVDLIAPDIWDDADRGRLLSAWRLLHDGKPTVAGIVLFGRAPQAALESTRVVVGALATRDIGGAFLDRKDLSGTLFELLRQIEAFLNLYLRTGHVIEGFAPERREDVPTAALREAVVNALVHRDYTIPGPVRVFVFPDRVEVISPVDRRTAWTPRGCESARTSHGIRISTRGSRTRSSPPGPAAASGGLPGSCARAGAASSAFP
jgi:ATP-dependent DNA helicase RecG